MLKDLKVSIDNLNDCWEFKSLPCVKPISSAKFNHEIWSGAQVFEVRVAYKPISKNPDKELIGERENLAVPTERRGDNRDDEGNSRKK